jgi:hypothetical protein
MGLPALEAHQRAGLDIHVDHKEVDHKEVGKIVCMVCMEIVGAGALVGHQRACVQRAAQEAARVREADPKLDEDERMAVSLQRNFEADVLLTSCQRAALNHVTTIARPLSDAAMPALTKRAAGLGFPPAQLIAAIRFIRTTAPLIIHFNPQTTLSLLLKDSHYRYPPPSTSYVF